MYIIIFFYLIIHTHIHTPNKQKNLLLPPLSSAVSACFSPYLLQVFILFALISLFSLFPKPTSFGHLPPSLVRVWACWGHQWGTANTLLNPTCHSHAFILLSRSATFSTVNHILLLKSLLVFEFLHNTHLF